MTCWGKCHSRCLQRDKGTFCCPPEPPRRALSPPAAAEELLPRARLGFIGSSSSASQQRQQGHQHRVRLGWALLQENKQTNKRRSCSLGGETGIKVHWKDFRDLEELMDFIVQAEERFLSPKCGWNGESSQRMCRGWGCTQCRAQSCVCLSSAGLN